MSGACLYRTLLQRRKRGNDLLGNLDQGVGIAVEVCMSDQFSVFVGILEFSQLVGFRTFEDPACYRAGQHGVCDFNPLNPQIERRVCGAPNRRREDRMIVNKSARSYQNCINSGAFGKRPGLTHKVHMIPELNCFSGQENISPQRRLQPGLARLSQDQGCSNFSDFQRSRKQLNSNLAQMCPG